MGQRTLANAFAAWSDHTLQMQSAKQAMQQVAARLINRQLSAAFYAWHEAALHKQHAVQSAQKVLIKLQQGCKVTLPACEAVLTSINLNTPLSIHLTTIDSMFSVLKQVYILCLSINQ